MTMTLGALAVDALGFVIERVTHAALRTPCPRCAALESELARERARAADAVKRADELANELLHLTPYCIREAHQ